MAAGIAAVQVDQVAVIALFAPAAHAVAADDLPAVRVAGDAVGRVALLAGVHCAVTAQVGQALALAADLAVAARSSVGQRRARRALMRCVIAAGDALAGVRRGAVARRVGRDADEMASGIAPMRAIIDAVVALFRRRERAVAANRRLAR